VAPALAQQQEGISGMWASTPALHVQENSTGQHLVQGTAALAASLITSLPAEQIGQRALMQR
jgi:hypothetical protein